MIKIITLLKKDFKFSIKYILITVLFCIISPILLIADGDNLYHLLSFYIPMVTLGVIIGKICYLEDSHEVKTFLKSLPYKKNILILSKYIEMLILNTLSLLYVIIIQLFLDKKSDVAGIIKLNILIFAFFIIYYSIYLYLYFSRNYYSAQNTMYIILAIVFVVIFYFNRDFININMLNGIVNTWVIIAIILFSILFCFLSIFFSTRSEY